MKSTKTQINRQEKDRKTGEKKTKKTSKKKKREEEIGNGGRE